MSLPSPMQKSDEFFMDLPYSTGLPAWLWAALLCHFLWPLRLARKEYVVVTGKEGANKVSLKVLIILFWNDFHFSITKNTRWKPRMLKPKDQRESAQRDWFMGLSLGKQIIFRNGYVSLHIVYWSTQHAWIWRWWANPQISTPGCVYHRPLLSWLCRLWFCSCMFSETPQGGIRRLPCSVLTSWDTRSSSKSLFIEQRPALNKVPLDFHWQWNLKTYKRSCIAVI